MSDLPEPQMTGAVIPYRMAASRLPGKALRDVAGKPALARVADRARAADSVGRVVIATTEGAEDDAIVELADQLGLGVYRGSTEDVLLRITEAAEQFGFDIVVEVDGDDLLCATAYMDAGVKLAMIEGVDMVSFRGLPLGATPSVLRTSALRRAVDTKDYSDTQTGFFRFIRESGLFSVIEPEAMGDAHRHDEVRMTLDYPEDLAFFDAVYTELDALGRDWGLTDVVALLRRRPELVAINSGLEDRYKEHFDAGLADMGLGAKEDE